MRWKKRVFTCSCWAVSAFRLEGKPQALFLGQPLNLCFCPGVMGGECTVVGPSHEVGMRLAFPQKKLADVTAGSTMAVASARGSPSTVDCCSSRPLTCVATWICTCEFDLRVTRSLCMWQSVCRGWWAKSGIFREGGLGGLRRWRPWSGKGHVHQRQSKRVGRLVEGEVASCLLHSLTDLISSLPFPSECTYGFLLCYFKCI